MALKVRVAPPRGQPHRAVSDVQKGDWVYVYGYWWRVSSRRPGGFGLDVIDVESPRGKHTALYLTAIMEARCG